MNKISFIIILFAYLLHAQNSTILQKKIDSLLNHQFFESSIAAVDIYDLSAKEVLFQKNNKLLLRPASNMKILSSAAALYFLGPDYQFITQLAYTGKIVNNTLLGDLYIIGGCDPDFTTEDLDTLILFLKINGVKEISGNIYGDISFKDSLFWGKGWMWDDDPSADAPYLSALNINDNAITVKVRTRRTGQPCITEVIPSTKFVTIINESETILSEKENTFSITRSWINRTNNILVQGKLNKSVLNDTGGVVKQINIFRPEDYFTTLFMEKLDSAEIKYKSGITFRSTPLHAKQLYSHKRSYSQVIKNLNTASDNLSAEMVLFALADSFYGRPASAENGLKMVDSLIYICGMDHNNYNLADGSGVSHYNLVTAELLINVLKYFYFQRPELYAVLYNSFALAGVEGTLKGRMLGTKGERNVRAKTGTLSGVSALSGYLTAKNGHHIAFSIIIQNFTGGSSLARFFQDRICNIVTEY